MIALSRAIATLFVGAVCLGVVAVGCSPKTPADREAAPVQDAGTGSGAPGDAAPASHPLLDHGWTLTSFGEHVEPVGAEGRPVTLEFDAASGRAAGFGGCNRYSAGYVLTADGLTFQAAISTKMACSDGMEIENAYLAALASVATYIVTDSTLVLNGANGPIAAYRATAKESAGTPPPS